MVADRAVFTAVRSKIGAELLRPLSVVTMGSGPTPDKRAEGLTDIPKSSIPAASTCLAAATALRIHSAPRTSATPNRLGTLAAGSTAAEAAATPAATGAGDIITKDESSLPSVRSNYFASHLCRRNKDVARVGQSCIWIRKNSKETLHFLLQLVCVFASLFILRAPIASSLV